MLSILVTRGSTAFNPAFWFSPSTGAAGGGVSEQILGTLLLLATTGLIALPLGYGAGVFIGAYASPKAARVLETLTVAVGGTPTILLGLARAAGETAPLIFTATVFFGAPALPGRVFDSPVQALPTHIFTLSQDSGAPEAIAQAWGSALVLVLITAALLGLAVALRNRFEGAR